jgi:hypothetical protein
LVTQATQQFNSFVAESIGNRALHLITADRPLAGICNRPQTADDQLRPIVGGLWSAKTLTAERILTTVT